MSEFFVMRLFCVGAELAAIAFLAAFVHSMKHVHFVHHHK